VIPIVFSPNMSVGVNVTYKLLELAAKLLKDYDAEIFEMHHNRKVDAPSGTAIAMGKAIADARGQNFEEVAVWARQGHTGPRVPGSIGFAALRGGDVVGDHQVTFAGSGERIVISHLSSSRAGYAQGAVKAALWEAEKKPGLYSMSDVLGL
jgi:4-hydroxy-tetrahydrodipicolinate reductase